MIQMPHLCPSMDFFDLSFFVRAGDVDGRPAKRRNGKRDGGGMRMTSRRRNGNDRTPESGPGQRGTVTTLR